MFCLHGKFIKRMERFVDNSIFGTYHVPKFAVVKYGVQNFIFLIFLPIKAVNPTNIVMEVASKIDLCEMLALKLYADISTGDTTNF